MRVKPPSPSYRPEEFLFQEPFFLPTRTPRRRPSRDHHGGLVYQPAPELLWHGPQIDAYATDHHEHETARGKLVLAGKRAF